MKKILSLIFVLLISFSSNLFAIENQNMDNITKDINVFKSNIEHIKTITKIENNINKKELDNFVQERSNEISNLNAKMVDNKSKIEKLDKKHYEFLKDDFKWIRIILLTLLSIIILLTLFVIFVEADAEPLMFGFVMFGLFALVYNMHISPFSDDKSSEYKIEMNSLYKENDKFYETINKLKEEISEKRGLKIVENEESDIYNIMNSLHSKNEVYLKDIDLLFNHFSELEEIHKTLTYSDNVSFKNEIERKRTELRNLIKEALVLPNKIIGLYSEYKYILLDIKYERLNKENLNKLYEKYNNLKNEYDKYNLNIDYEKFSIKKGA